ncbi:energy transducer TonB [Massilia sp. PAMC28688]|uniref:energy transducer TonB n=1 Tax=Massilia sp. PAMC28688 TaxID=2861283 RepID=UPI001C63271B|nr:energy transducer TonB [Massilia sp. PAMC28688]QYF93713.1 energy transducer TonB [Massilia sp. PAMC28688]
MNKKNIALGAALVVLVVWLAAPDVPKRTNRTLAKAFPAGLLESPASCTTPQWPNEARRYEVDGVTVLNFQIDEAGNIADATVARSSGWRLLDEAAMRSLVKCKFKAGLDEHSRTATYPIQFVWTLTGPATIRPALVAGSCAPSGRFAGFEGFNRDPSGTDGVLVRFLVNETGTPYAVKAEPADGQALQARAAMEYIQTCKFATDPSVPGERTDTMYGRVLVQAKRQGKAQAAKGS